MKRLRFLQQPLFRLMQGSFWGGVFAFLGSQGIAYLYGPEVYGQYAVVLAFISTLGVIPSLKLELAGFKKEGNEKHFPIKPLLLTTFLVGVPLILVIGCFPFPAVKSSWNYLMSLRWFLMAGVLLFSLNQIAQFYLLYEHKYKKLQYYRIVVPLVIYSIAVGTGWGSGAHQWLYAAWIIGWVAGIGLVLLSIIPLPKGKLPQRLKEFWRENRPLIRFELPSSLLMLLANYLPLFLVSLYFGWKEAGLLALGLRLSDLLIQYYSRNAQQVILGRSRENGFHTKIQKLFWQESGITFLFFFCLLAAFRLANHWHLLPTSWTNLFSVLVALIGWKWGQALYTPISAWLIQYQKNQWGLVVTVALLFVPVLSIFLFPQQFFQFLWLLSAGYFFVYLLGVILISQLAKKTA